MPPSNEVGLPLGWSWCCPACRHPLDAATTTGGEDPRGCPNCGWTPTFEGALPDLRPPDRQADLDRFAAAYTALRRAEGRGAWQRDDFEALPWPGPGMPAAWEWRIRTVSFECLYDRVLPLAQRAAGEGEPARALDLGAGLGWLGHRLAWAGWRALALDLCPAADVGLGAATLLQERLARARAEEDGIGSLDAGLADFHQLPVAETSVHLVVFNAALHYSWNLEGALAEAWRCLVPGGYLAILDSPFYESDAAGAAMVEAQRLAFREQHGVAAAGQEGRGYLTAAALRAVPLSPMATWVAMQPRRAWTWRLRRAWRRLRLGRESADFPLWIAVKP